MVIRRKSNFLILTAILVIFATSTYCYSYDCNCVDYCNGPYPPCVKVTFEGVKNCSDDSPASINGTHMLAPVAEGIWMNGSIIYYPIYQPYSLYQLIDCNDCDPEEIHFFSNLSCSEIEEGVSVMENFIYKEEWGECYLAGDPGYAGYGGSATVKWIWDCNDCGACEGESPFITVSSYKSTLYFSAQLPDTIPVPRLPGEKETIEMICDDPNVECVITDYRIEVQIDPEKEGVEEVESSRLVSVSVEPTGCEECPETNPCKAVFVVQSYRGIYYAEAWVTLQATFLSSGEIIGSIRAILYIKNGRITVCFRGANLITGPGPGITPITPSPGEIAPPIRPPAPGNGHEIPPICLHPGVRGFLLSRAQPVDYKPGYAARIEVRLPCHGEYFAFEDPLPFMPGWSASVDDSNTVVVKSPDQLKYIYPEDFAYKLTVIKDVEDANLILYDYNSTDPNLIDKIEDACDPNIYLEFKYDTNDLLETLTAWDYSDSRSYTLAYDDANRLTSVSGSCSSCGGGSVRYSFDANDLVKYIKDANDDVMYEYVYNAAKWPTDIYLGEAEDGNHIHHYIYTSIGNGDFIVDTYDYNNANSYRVRREYRDSAGISTKVVNYENLNEDPDNTSGESYIEQIVYFYDSNNMITKMVVIPPLGDSNDPPNPYTGIRKEYTYDPNTGDLLTEKWFDRNDANFTVASYTYGYIWTDDGNDIFQSRILTYTDARGAVTQYTYDGNDTDPNLRIMPQVTKGISGTQQLKYRFTYDNRNRVILEELLVGDANTVIAKTKYVHDDFGNLINRHDYIDPASGDSNEITIYEYNGFNERVKATLPTGVMRGWSYNESGKIDYEVVYDPCDPNYVFSKTKHYYDENGRTVKIAEAIFDSTFSVDAEPNDSKWFWTEYEHDLWGNRTKVIEDANGLALETAYEYNNLGEVLKVTLPNGKWTKTIRDGRGYVSEQIVGYYDSGEAKDITVAVTEYIYDGNGNMKWQTGPYDTDPNTPDEIKTRYDYDDFDRVIGVTKGL